MWRNWSGSVRSKPSQIVNAATEREIVELIQTAVSHHKQIRPVGSAHSFSPICQTDSILLSINGLSGISETNAAEKRVTIKAGTVIHDIGEPLCNAQLALPNQGDIDVQTLAGAIGTGTHGTGLAFSNMSSLVQSVRMATAVGEIITLERGKDDVLLDAAAVSFGTLGIFLAFTLNVTNRYRLLEQNSVLETAVCLETFPHIDQSHRNAEFYWLPADDKCVLKTFDETDTPMTAENEMEIELAAAGTIERYLLPDRVHWSHRIFPSKRDILFNEMEFAVPIDNGIACFKAIQKLMREKYADISWAVEYRTLDADTAFLSQAYKRPSACISIHEDAAKDCKPFFKDAQAVFLAFEGRPHWGKFHFLNADRLANIYPKWNDFLTVRQTLDPEGLFLNDALKMMFGL
jgi:FAD/FMN-containing dehydrogenase